MNPRHLVVRRLFRGYILRCFGNTNYNTNLLPCGPQVAAVPRPDDRRPGLRRAEGNETVYLPVFRLGSSVALSAVFEPIGDLRGGEARRFGQLPLLSG